MVQILPQANPGFGSSLVDAISGAVGDVVEGKQKRREAIEKEGPHAQTMLGKLFKEHGISDSYDSDQKLRTQKLADEYARKGYDRTQASFAALEDLKAGFPDRSKTKVGKSGTETEQAKAQDQPKTILNSITDFLQKPTDEVVQQGLPKVAKFLQNPLQMAASAPIERLREAVSAKNKELADINKEEKEKEKLKSFKLPKPAAELSLKEILQLPADAVTSLPMEQQRIIGQKIAEGAQGQVDLAFSKGLDPTGAIAGIERAAQAKGVSPIEKENALTKQPLAIAGLTGQLLKDLGLFGLASKGKTLGQKVALGGSGFGASEASRALLGEGRAATPGELGFATAFGAGGELLAPVLKGAMAFIKKIPSAFKTVAAVAKSTGGAVTEEKIVKEAVKNLEARGVSVVKAAEGDKAALNEIQKESIKVANTFEKADKFNRKEIEKLRGEKAEKLVQSPLEEHFKPEKEVAHRPETIAKEAERIKPLETRIKQNERRLRDLQYEIFSSENRLKETGAELGESGRARLQGLIDHNKMSHQRALNEIRSAEFEIKHKKPPMTSEDIQKQIAKSFEEIREGIHNPTAKKVESIKKALEQNEKALHSAEKLVSRGELPGPPVFDEFIKIKQEYVKAYGDLIDELNGFIRENKNVKAQSAKVANAQQLKELIEKTRDQAKASVINQIDKRKAQKILSGPSGALWKNLLKDVRTDVDAFKQQWVKVNSITSPLEKKTAEVAQKARNEPKASPKPLEGPEVAKAAAEEKKATKSFKDEISGFGEKFKKATSTEKDIVGAEKSTNNYLNRLVRLPKSLLRGGIIGAVQSIFEEVTGIKIPTVILGAAIPGNIIGRGVGIGGVAIAHKYTNQLFDYIEEQKLRKLRNTPEFHEYRKKLEQRYSKARVNRIVKATQEKK